MAKPILVANWKNYPESPAATRALLAGLSKKKPLYKELITYIAPPLAYLDPVSDRVASFAGLAVQDFPEVASGTHTGLVSVEILKSYGAKLAVIGHSERRALGETDKVVAKKVKAALGEGMVALLCVGEKSYDKEGEHFEFLRNQIKSSLESLKRKDSISKLMIAYEPVWAIGARAKRSVLPEELAQAVVFIRKVLADMFGREAADKVSILYGGSVDSSNAQKLFEHTGIRGFLVGRASLDAKEFAAIAEELSHGRS